MQHLRGWIGVGAIIVGIGLFAFEKTRVISFLVAGFGMGMASTGFR